MPAVRAFSLDEIRCDCPAGLHGNGCWHAPAVYLRLVADGAIAEVA